MKSLIKETLGNVAAGLLILTVLAVAAYATDTSTDAKYNALVEKDRIFTFTATWCGPCRSQHSINNQLKKSGVPVIEIDVDREPDLFARVTSVGSIPQVFVVRNKKIYASFVGVTSYRLLKDTWEEAQATKQ